MRTWLGELMAGVSTPKWEALPSPPPLPPAFPTSFDAREARIEALRAASRIYQGSQGPRSVPADHVVEAARVFEEYLNGGRKT